MNAKQVAKKILPPIISESIKSIRSAIAYRRYLYGEKVPFSTGYVIYRKKLLTDVLKNEKLLTRFRQGELLPEGYGIGVDERCVEYPWLIGQLDDKPGIFLDAGSTLNFDFLLDLPIFASKLIHILTLAPENDCFWQKSVSYLFHDLRNIPSRDNYYDTISCISTLEHVGCDNSDFTGKDSDRENQLDDYIIAVKELCRVLKPGGNLFITVPYGVYSYIGIQQQFDRRMHAKMVDALAEFGEVQDRFYLYSANGWNVARQFDCDECHYVEWSAKLWAHGKTSNLDSIEPDLAVAARAVACVRMTKKAEN